MGMNDMKKKMKWIISIILCVICIILIQLPWFNFNGERYSIYQAFFALKESGAAVLSEEGAALWNSNSSDIFTVLTIQFTLVMVCQIFLSIYLVACSFKRNKYLNIGALIVLLVYLYIDEMGFGSVADSYAGKLFPLVLFLILSIEILTGKIIDVWDDFLKLAEENKEKEKVAKEEERKRLDFPGKYTKLFYQMVWKNFRYDWKDYCLYLICTTIISTFSFAGIGIYQMMAEIHRSELFLIGQGLGLILWNAMIPMAICMVFLMTFVMIFYLKKWTKNYSIFVTLGIRKKALYTIMTLELLFGFVCAVICGFLLGNAIMFLFEKVIYSVLGEGITLAEVTWLTYAKGFGVIVLIYLIALMATRDIISNFNLIKAATRNVQKEKMPSKRKTFIAIGISESAYHELKKAVDPDYQAKSLTLDAKGKRVYVVHQQDRSVKAQPLDWSLGKKNPYLHIGSPCEAYIPSTNRGAFTKRIITGEEIGSLVGCFRQGRLENIVVFSDEYFKKAQEMWKYTNIHTGEIIKEETMRIEEVTIKQGPTKLILIRANQSDIPALEKDMKKFEQNYKDETPYDLEVCSCYSKQTTVADLSTEYAMKLTVNLFVFITMMLVSICF